MTSSAPRINVLSFHDGSERNASRASRLSCEMDAATLCLAEANKLTGENINPSKVLIKANKRSE